MESSLEALWRAGYSVQTRTVGKKFWIVCRHKESRTDSWFRGDDFLDALGNAHDALLLQRNRPHFPVIVGLLLLCLFSGCSITGSVGVHHSVQSPVGWTTAGTAINFSR